MCNFYVSCWQVNGIPLIGETHKEVVSILKELPVHVYLVCARIIPPSVPNSDEEDDDDVCLSLKELLAGFNDKVGTAWRGGKLRGVDLILKSFSLKTAWITVDQHVKRNSEIPLMCSTAVNHSTFSALSLFFLFVPVGPGLCHSLSYSWGHHQAWRAPHVTSFGHVGERGSGGRAGERRGGPGLQYPGLSGQRHASEPFYK